MVETALRAVADTVFVWDVAHGAPDLDVLELARTDDRILITEDYDFGNLIFGQRRPPPRGLIHLVLSGMTKDQRDAKFAAEIPSLLQLAPGNFVIFSRYPPRARSFP